MLRSFFATRYATRFTSHSASAERASSRMTGPEEESEGNATVSGLAPGRPRWGLAVLVGAAAGAVPYGLWWLGVWGYAFYLFIRQSFGQGAAGVGGVATLGNTITDISPALHLLLVAGAALWVARRAGAAPVWHGLLVGLASVASNLALDLYFFPPLSEAVTYALVGAGGGFLGGLRSRAMLARQEALYEAGRDVSRAHSPHEVARAVGERLEACLGVAGVTLWGRGAPTGEASREAARRGDAGEERSEGCHVLLGAWTRKGGVSPFSRRASPCGQGSGSRGTPGAPTGVPRIAYAGAARRRARVLGSPRGAFLAVPSARRPRRPPRGARGGVRREV